MIIILSKNIFEHFITYILNYTSRLKQNKLIFNNNSKIFKKG